MTAKKKEVGEVTVSEDGILEVTESELVVQEETGTDLSSVVNRKGFEKLDKSSIKLPTATLLQAMSPEVIDEEFEDYGFKAGMMIHSILLEEMEKVFIPIMLFDDNILFAPRKDNDKKAFIATLNRDFGADVAAEIEAIMAEGNILCRSLDAKTGTTSLGGGQCAKCRLNKFNGAEKPWCTANINVLALFEGHDLPVILRFNNTSYKHGDSFKNKAYYGGGDLHSRKYKVKIKTNKNDDGQWYETTVMPAGKTDPDSDVFKKALFFHDQYINMTIEAEGADEQSTTKSETNTPSY